MISFRVYPKTRLMYMVSYDRNEIVTRGVDRLKLVYSLEGAWTYDTLVC